MADLTHFDDKGGAHMVDVSDKDVTDRIARAVGWVKVAPETYSIIESGGAKKGDVLQIAQLAGIMGAKKTPDLIPLCHPLPITKVSVDLVLDGELPGVRIEATVKTTGQTGVEMEALTAVSVAALTVHDMVVDLVVSYPELVIGSVEVVLDTHPHDACPSIETAYQQLVGSSISRGFGRQLTTLFGGPNGCTHIGALLRAMAPVAIQSMYSMQMASADGYQPWDSEGRSDEERDRAQAFVTDSCHVWAQGGDMMAAVERGEPMESPIWIRERFEKLGLLDELDRR